MFVEGKFKSNGFSQALSLGEGLIYQLVDRLPIHKSIPCCLQMFVSMALVSIIDRKGGVLCYEPDLFSVYISLIIIMSTICYIEVFFAQHHNHCNLVELNLPNINIFLTTYVLFAKVCQNFHR